MACDCRSVKGGLPSVVLLPPCSDAAAQRGLPSLRIRGGSGALGELRIPDSGIVRFWASQGVREGLRYCFGPGFMFAIVSIQGG